MPKLGLLKVTLKTVLEETVKKMTKQSIKIKKSMSSAALIFSLVFFQFVSLVGPFGPTALAQPATKITNLGYNFNVTGGGGGFNSGWTGGNLGDQWEEGDWVPYMMTIENVQTDYSGLSGLPDIIQSFDFYDSNNDAVLVDMVRDIQVGTTILDDNHAFPTAGGSPQPNTLLGFFAGKEDPAEHQWTGFQLLNLPNSQVNRNLDGSADTAPGTDRHVVIIHPSDLTSHGIPTSADTIVIYLQAHLARTFVWSNSFQDQYALNATTAAWGGYLYNTDSWASESDQGAAHYPGSSGHTHLESFSGSQDVPIPVPPTPNGAISGHKYLDNPPLDSQAGGGAIGVGDSPLSGWRIFLEGTLKAEPISFSASTLTLGDGSYSFPQIDNEGTYTISEAAQREVPAETGYSETYPYDGLTVGAQPATSTSIPTAGRGPEGWGVTLSHDNPTVSLDFANVNFGSLTITKVVDLGSVVNPSGISEDFTIHISGPNGYSNDIVFHLVSGVLQAPTSVTIDNLSPGTYTVSESDPGPEWSVSGTGDVTVSGGSTASSTVTNTFVPGSLEITKIVDFAGAGSSLISQTFTVKVVGPSYPGPAGVTHDFIVTNGVLSGSPWLLSNLIPGDYTITETGVSGWTETVPAGPITVVAGQKASAEVTNAFIPGSLEITKIVDFGGANSSLISQTFTVKVIGPSYPGPAGITHDFVVTNGVLSGSPWLLSNLIPGDYTITENGASGWTETVPAGPITVVAGQKVSAEITNTFVPGSLTITKVLDLTGYLFPNDITVDFSITVTGPSYPSGTTLTFHVVNGVLTDSPQTLSNLIPGVYSVSEADPGIMWSVSGGGDVSVVAGQTAQSSVTNTIKLPHTTMSLFTSDAVVVTEGQTILLRIEDTNDGDVPLSNAHVHLMANGVFVPGFSTMFNSSPYFDAASDTNSNGLLDPGETWVWKDIPYVINADTTFLAWGHGLDPLGNPVDYNHANPEDPTSISSEHQTFDVNVIHPNTKVTIVPDVLETTAGENVLLTITEENTGDVDLSNASVVLNPGAMTLDNSSPYFSSNQNGDNTLAVGEVWTWTNVPILISADTTFTVTGDGLDPLENHITFPAYPDEQASVTVKVIGATRTLGFWQTHTSFTSFVFSTYFAGGMQIGSAPHKGLITNILSAGQSQLFGAFYSSIPKKSTGSQRTALDKARMQLLQQLVAAKLNFAAFGGSAATQTLINNADAAYAGSSASLILSYVSLLGAYNSSGDTIAIPPSLPATGKATPKTSQSYANIVFWDAP